MSSPAYMDPALTRDRQAFLDMIHTHDQDKESAYEAILDDLILWSMEQADALKFTARSETGHKQATVSFCLKSYPDVRDAFWAAYPQKTVPSKITLLPSLPGRIPADTWQFLYDEVFKFGDTNDGARDHPIVRFSTLLVPSNLKRLKEIMAAALGRLEPRSRSAPGPAE